MKAEARKKAGQRKTLTFSQRKGQKDCMVFFKKVRVDVLKDRH